MTLKLGLWGLWSPEATPPAQRRFGGEWACNLPEASQAAMWDTNLRSSIYGLHSIVRRVFASQTRKRNPGILIDEVAMVKRTIMFALLAASFTCFSLAAMADSTKSDDVARIQNAAEVFHEIMATPDKAIPQELVESARCIAIIPGEKKVAFIVGGNYGKGLVTCRTSHGWSAPAFLTVGGGSYGLQIGGSSTDIVMIFRNRKGLDSLLSDKFKIGGSATAAAGPVGRHAAASTDVKLNAQILTYARSKGAFAGVSLNGAVVQPDDSGNHALYGPNASAKRIVDGRVHVPREAHSLIAELDRYSRQEAATNR